MVDLTKCKPGDKLRSKHGLILTYVGPNNGDYPHTDSDHDIVEVIPDAQV